MTQKLIITLAGFALLRLLLSLLFPITADESYYWLWSKHLALSYVDHPPMVAYLSFLLTGGTSSLIGLRLGTLLIATAVSLFIFFIAKEIFNKEIAFWSAVFFQIIPHFLIIWPTMFVELPLTFFWCASLLVLIKIIKSQNLQLWYLLGLLVGLGCLSKYTMLLFWPSLFLFTITTPEQRPWFKSRQPYLAFLLSLLVFSPVLIWNAQHQFASFAFHAAKTTSDTLGTNFPAFIGDQLVHFTPFFCFALWGAWRFGLKRGPLTRVFVYFSAVPLLVFLLAAVKIKVWAHWPSVGYIAAIPLTIAYLWESQKRLRKFFTAVIVFLLLIISILFWISPAILSSQSAYHQNQQLAQALPSGTKIFARTNVAASLLEFYTQRPIYLATGFMKPGSLWGEKQYELWGIPDLKKGESVLYFGEDNTTIRQQAAEHFSTVTEINYQLNLIEDYISHYKMLRFDDYKENEGHP